MKHDINVYTQLAQEVLYLCRKNDIPCILSDDSAHMLHNCEKYGFSMERPLYLIVLANDFDKVNRLLTRNLKADRAIASMKNGNRYPDLSIQYVNTDYMTIYTDKASVLPNAGVFILPLRRAPHGKLKSVYTRVEAWEIGCGKKLYPKLLRRYKLRDQEKGIIFSTNRHRCKYKVEEITNPYTMEIFGKVYPVSGDRLKRKKYRYHFTLGLPYAHVPELQQEIQDRIENAPANNMYKEVFNIVLNKGLKKIMKRMWPVSNDWKKVNCVNKRDKLAAYYMPKKDLLDKIYALQDEKRMRSELYRYHKAMRRWYKRTKMTIVFDQDIFEYYCWAYREVGPKWIKKARKHIPEAWK